MVPNASPSLFPPRHAGSVDGPNILAQKHPDNSLPHPTSDAAAMKRTLSEFFVKVPVTTNNCMGLRETPKHKTLVLAMR